MGGAHIHVQAPVPRLLPETWLLLISPGQTTLCCLDPCSFRDLDSKYFSRISSKKHILYQEEVLVPLSCKVLLLSFLTQKLQVEVVEGIGMRVAETKILATTRGHCRKVQLLTIDLHELVHIYLPTDRRLECLVLILAVVPVCWYLRPQTSTVGPKVLPEVPSFLHVPAL